MSTPVPPLVPTASMPLATDSDAQFDAKAFPALASLNPFGVSLEAIAASAVSNADAALAAALGGDLPPLTGQALKYLRVNAGETAAEFNDVLASPAFTGTPTAPTATPGTNTTQIATTAFAGWSDTSTLSTASGAVSTAVPAGVQEIVIYLDLVDTSDNSTISISFGTGGVDSATVFGSGVVFDTFAGTFAAFINSTAMIVGAPTAGTMTAVVRIVRDDPTTRNYSYTVQGNEKNNVVHRFATGEIRGLSGELDWIGLNNTALNGGEVRIRYRS